MADSARTLYGLLAERPAAPSAGDGALYVAVDNDHTLYQVQSSNWIRVARTPLPAYAAVSGATQALDPRATTGFHLDVLHDVTLSTVGSAAEGQVYTLALDGDPDHAHTVTFGTGFATVGAALTLATGATERLIFLGHDGLLEDVQPRAGAPVLYGPYVVTVADIPHDGLTKTLWTPQVGDVLLRLFADENTVTQWDTGWLEVNQEHIGSDVPRHRFLAANAGTIAGTDPSNGVFDSIIDAQAGFARGPDNSFVYRTAHIFDSTDPVQIQWHTTGSDPGAGHVEIYALIARAVAP